MPYNSIKNVEFNLSLYDNSNETVDGMIVNFQFYYGIPGNWKSFYEDTIKNGQLRSRIAVNSQRKELKLFLEIIKNGIIPAIRIIPKKGLLQHSNQQVIASNFETILDEIKNQLLFDFGTYWLFNTADFEEIDHSGQILIATNIPLFQLSNSLKEKESLDLRHKEALFENEKKDDSLKNLKSDIKLHQKEIKSKDKEIVTKSKALDESLEKIEGLKIKLIQAEQQSKTIESNYAAIQNQLSLLNTQANQKTKLFNESQTKIDRLEKELSDKTLAYNKLTNDLSKIEEKIKEGNLDAKTSDGPIPVRSLYSGLINDINTAENEISSSPYKLSNVSIKIKGILNSDLNNNLGIQLLGLDKYKDVSGEAFSEISFDINSDPIKRTDTIITPEVIGLTETAARRVLQNSGLQLNPVYQNNIKVPNGAAFKQAPLAGTQILKSDYVTVIFSKNE